MKLEMLLAFDDNTWDTEVFEVPSEIYYSDYPDTMIPNWWERAYMGLSTYRRVDLVAVYNQE